MSNFDEALERFHLGDLEYAGGLANHGPMGAEALERLGHPALIPAFLGLYAARLPVAEVGQTLSEGEFKAALGDCSRRGDWVATYEARLENADFRQVAAEVLPVLMPGLFAGAGHGLLRTAHALRSLELLDTPLRRRELARGLGYWSARFQSLPGKLGIGATPAFAALDSFSSWPLLSDPSARIGLFFDCVRRLESFEPFRESIEGVALPEATEVGDFVGGLCRLGASLYLDHSGARMAYVHGVTIPSALRLILPYLKEEDARVGCLYSMQALGALHSVFGEASTSREHDDEVVRVAESWDEIRYHAACSLQEHAIKMVEACWREDQVREDPIFRLAASDAALKIDARGRVAQC